MENGFLVVVIAKGNKVMTITQYAYTTSKNAGNSFLIDLVFLCCCPAIILYSAQQGNEAITRMSKGLRACCSTALD
jgi:hypothetical protein